MLLKYHAEEERWQNLICSDLKHYATHFWLFVCLMCAKYGTKFIPYHLVVHRSQTQRKEKNVSAGREIATKFFTLTTKSWKLVAKLTNRMFHHNLTERYSELKRFAKINPRQTSSLSLFPKRSTCISINK